jgi:aminoglycoside phosphotransferase (APT) family kinase protein
VVELAARLADIHAVEWRDTGLERLGRPGGYLERQLARWGRQWEHNATREVPGLEAVAEWLTANLPTRSDVTLVHGDYKLDNVIYAPAAPARILAVLDWELATLGDPLADLGFTCAVYVEPGEEPDPMLGFSSATTASGSPTRSELVDAYVAAGGRPPDSLRWYECLAIWKVAVIIEGGYKRFLAGSTNDPFFTEVEAGVPRLAERALALTRAD